MTCVNQECLRVDIPQRKNNVDTTSSSMFYVCNTECTTYGGPVFKTEAACYQGIKNVGLPYLKTKVS